MNFIRLLRLPLSFLFKQIDYRIVFFPLIFISCGQKLVCDEPSYEQAAPVVSINGLPKMKAGAQQALTIGVHNDRTVCVTQAEATIRHLEHSFFYIEAKLVHTGNKGGAGCKCNKDSVVFTQVFFTPRHSGTFFFNIDKDLVSGSGQDPKMVIIVE